MLVVGTLLSILQHDGGIFSDRVERQAVLVFELDGLLIDLDGELLEFWLNSDLDKDLLLQLQHCCLVRIDTIKDKVSKVTKYFGSEVPDINFNFTTLLEIHFNTL